MKDCVTHHHACDCREAKFAKLEADLAAAQPKYLEPTREDALELWKLFVETEDDNFAEYPLHECLKQLGFVRKVRP